MSIILMSEVGGKPSILLMKMVVITSIVVYAQGCLKEERLEEGGGKGYCSQKKGREVGGHHLACNLPLHYNYHAYSLFTCSYGFFSQSPGNDCEDWHVHFLAHYQLVRDQSHSGPIQASHGHVNRTCLERVFENKDKLQLLT